MKKMIKQSLAIIMTFFFALTTLGTVKVTATDSDEEYYKTLYEQLIETYYQQQLEIQDLRHQLEMQSLTPQTTARPPVYAPLVKLLSPQSVSVSGGQTLEVELSVKNIGTSSASNLLTQAIPAGNAPFTVEFLDGTNNVATLNENGTRVMKLRIAADPNAEAGLYSVTLNHSYKNRESDNRSSSDTLTVRIVADTQTPSVSMRTFAVNKNNLKPGDQFILTARFENTGEGTAYEVQAVVDKLEVGTFYMSGDPSAYQQRIQGKSDAPVEFSFAITPQTRSGAYPLSFKLTYKDQAGKVLENTFTYYINVTAAASEDRAVVERSQVEVPTGTVGVGANAAMTLQYTNSGSATAKNIKVTAILANENAIVPTSSNIQSIPSLAPGESKALTFSFSPTTASRSQHYVIGFRCEYETGVESADGTPQVESFEQYVGFNAYNPEEESEDPSTDAKFNKPRIIVSEYSVDPQIVRAGREFDMNLTFQNASPLKAVNNIKITLSAVETTERKGAVFTPVGGSNTFYIDEINPKGTVDKTLTMFTVPDADPRTYNIMVTFSYQDEDFNDYQEQEQISINVKQVTRIETSEVYLPDSSALYQPIYIYFSVINSGRVSLSNLRVRVDGNFDTSNADMYIGNLGKGNSIYYEGNFSPTEAGEQKGEIVVYGEDDTGEIVEIRKPFTLNAFEMTYEESYGDGMFRPDMPGIEVPTEEKSFWGKALDFIKNPIVWGVSAAVVAAVVIIVIRIVRKKRRIDFDE